MEEKIAKTCTFSRLISDLKHTFLIQCYDKHFTINDELRALFRFPFSPPYEIYAQRQMVSLSDCSNGWFACETSVIVSTFLLANMAKCTVKKRNAHDNSYVQNQLIGWMAQKLGRNKTKKNRGKCDNRPIDSMKLHSTCINNCYIWFALGGEFGSMDFFVTIIKSKVAVCKCACVWLELKYNWGRWLSSLETSNAHTVKQLAQRIIFCFSYSYVSFTFFAHIYPLVCLHWYNIFLGHDKNGLWEWHRKIE